MNLFTVSLCDYTKPNLQLNVAAENAAVAVEEALRDAQAQKLLEESTGVEIRCHRSRGHVFTTQPEVRQTMCAGKSPEPEPEAPKRRSSEEMRKLAAEFCEVMADILKKQ